MLRRILLLAGALVALLAPASARAGSTMFVGAVENAPLVADAGSAKAQVDLANLAGFDTLRVGTYWARGRASIIPAPDLLRLQNAAMAAQLDGMRLIVSVSNFDARETPNTADYRAQFAIYCVALARALPSVKDFIIGNEPNLNLFWMPQYTKPVYGTKRVHGKRVRYLKRAPKGVSGAAYEARLAEAYDKLKSVDPDINVIGVALSPRGTDNPLGKRPSHSPITFIRELGAAYRASHRTEPIMDAFGIHPYPESSRIPPTLVHPKSNNIGIADYPKLTKALYAAFKGTAQPGATLPIVYDEFGVQSSIPQSKRHLYTNLGAIAARDGVPESVQAKYYRQAVELSYCQPNVMGMLFFHVVDERNAAAWQSGLYYARRCATGRFRPAPAPARERSSTRSRCRKKSRIPRAISRGAAT